MFLLKKIIIIFIIFSFSSICFQPSLAQDDDEDEINEPITIFTSDELSSTVVKISTISLPIDEDTTTGVAKSSKAVQTPVPTPVIPKQIAIEALVVEVGENFNKEIGLRYGLMRDNAKNPNSNLKGIDMNFMTDPNTQIYVPRFQTNKGEYTVGLEDKDAAPPGLDLSLSGITLGSGEISAMLRAYIQSGDAEIRSQPIAVALEGTEAYIQTVDQIPFQDVKFVGSRLTPFLDVSFETVGITLNVTPTIEGDKKDKVRLKITKLEVSQVTSYIKNKSITRPVVAKSEANTEVVLSNKETLVLGGLKSEREATSIERLPILGKLPIIGALFRHKRDTIEKTNIYFFITPIVLEPGENPVFPKDFTNEDNVSLILN